MMNSERIEALAKLSMIEVIDTCDYNGMPTVSKEFSKEKFAELIIKECMKVSMPSAGLDAEYEAWYLIQQHFGVK
jgi:hypothetical protein